MTAATFVDAKAPHGRDDNGTPLAPYGYKVDGDPRISKRGATAGSRGNGNSTARPRAAASPGRPKSSTSNLSDADRKGMLTELAGMLFVAPLATVSQVPAVVSKIGIRQATALAGDAFILSQYLPSIADGLILLSKTKPKTLAWMDKAEQNAPYLVLASALIQAGKSLIQNHLSPNPTLATAARNLVATQMNAMAEAVNEQAAAHARMAAQAMDETVQFAAAA